jgi:RNA polymerase sigma-70 factor (ECF subfamily)
MAETVKQITDEHLIEAFRSGDEKAFAELVRRYERELYNFLFRFLGRQAAAEDVFQEAFLQVHLSVDRFETHRRFRPWLYTIAANKARDYLRREKRRPAVQLTGSGDDDDGTRMLQEMVRDDTTPDVVLHEKEQKELVRKVVASVPEHLREILVLGYFEQLSYKDMAEVLGIPLGTVKSRLHAAVASFGKLYRAASE